MPKYDENSPYISFLKLFKRNISWAVNTYEVKFAVVENKTSADILKNDISTILSEHSIEQEHISNLEDAKSYVQARWESFKDNQLQFPNKFHIVDILELDKTLATATMMKLGSIENEMKKNKVKILFISTQEQYREIMTKTEFWHFRTAPFFEENGCIRKESLYRDLNETIANNKTDNKKIKL